MTPSIWQLVIVLIIVLLLFGRGKIPQLMGDMAKGLKAFKKGMSNEDENKGESKIENNTEEDKK
ncbi:MAG: Sec-independent protein translocase protein TatA [Alphaproteobacteria bacterium MarineAlpha5_Bin12]|nr:MAG: Sec-independent protein translocase protein TatA [Alphaproteobacteria bacterium MarineAlpha5_Bin12]|tara:strand:- start:308 stop:499 length:192 start_codon:yes stop_codon:yes gene_type:complete